jgi:hypothetical protein
MDLGTEALPHFIDAVKRERDPRRRSRLIRVVWQFRDRSALPFLAEALQDSDDQVWKDALDGIVTVGGDQALQLLHDAQRAMLGVGDAEDLGWPADLPRRESSTNAATWSMLM